MHIEKATLKFYACGRNDLGQLGEFSRDNVYRPEELERLENFDVIDLVGGKNNSAAITGRGDIVICGENDSGQLGSRQNTLITRFSFENWKQISCWQQSDMGVCLP